VGPNADEHGPAPGEAKNCVRCRFFITGPAFLAGLVAHFNAIIDKLQEASQRYRVLQGDIKRLADEQIAAEQQGKPFAQVSERDLAHERLAQCAMEVDHLAQDGHATYALVERCRALLNQKQGD
jgi:Ni2+-binding GTPase involved in maturation of urease and hydrogenase